MTSYWNPWWLGDPPLLEKPQYGTFLTPWLHEVLAMALRALYPELQGWSKGLVFSTLPIAWYNQVPTCLDYLCINDNMINQVFIDLPYILSVVFWYQNTMQEPHMVLAADGGRMFCSWGGLHCRWIRVCDSLRPGHRKAVFFKDVEGWSHFNSYGNNTHHTSIACHYDSIGLWHLFFVGDCRLHFISFLCFFVCWEHFVCWSISSGCLFSHSSVLIWCVFTSQIYHPFVAWALVTCLLCLVSSGWLLQHTSPYFFGPQVDPSSHLGVVFIPCIWVNYNELTATSLGIMVSKGNHPQMALIQGSEIL